MMKTSKKNDKTETQQNMMRKKNTMQNTMDMKNNEEDNDER